MVLNLISIQNILKLHYNFIHLNYFHLKKLNLIIPKYSKQSILFGCFSRAYFMQSNPTVFLY